MESPKIGRPKIQVNQKDFEKLCGLFCTQEDIANWFECSVDTISRWCKHTYGAPFADVIKRKSSTAKESLRRAQLAVALKGNVSMLIWLGKQYLDQKDKVEIPQQDNNNQVIIYKSYDPKKLKADVSK